MESLAARLDQLAPQIRSVDQLSQTDLRKLLEVIGDWSAAHGLLVVDPKTNVDVEGMTWKGAAITLSPTCIPRDCFNFGVEIAPLFSLLFHRISQHPTFLEESLETVINFDEFTRKLLEIYQICKKEGFEQPISLGIYRSDYMIDMALKDNEVISSLKQVEVNAISAAFSHLGHLATLLHQYLVSSCPHLYKGLCCQDIPDNDCHLLVPSALSKAHNVFIEQRKDKLEDNHRIVVFLVAQPGERNRIDQRHIEFELFERYNISLVRTSLIDIYNNARLSENKNLILNHNGEDIIGSVAYFRSCYTPDDYPTEKEWSARLMIERSSAIKAPSISYHLCGTKKVQQVLGDESVLSIFFPDEPEIPKKLMKSFAGMYDLNREGKFKDIHKEAIKNPENFVMKPQREGGGSLVTGDDIKTAIETWDDHKLRSHILMERIKPFPMPNFLIFGGKLSEKVNCIPELGIFHSYMADSDNVYLDETKGYLVRTKPSDVNDGGVAAGRAALDSVCLCDIGSNKCNC